MDHDSIQRNNTIHKYVFSSLTPDEKTTFEAHLASCVECLEELHRAIDDLELVDKFVGRKLSPEQESFFVPHYFGCDRCSATIKDTEKLVAALKDAARRGSFRLPQSGERWSFREWLDSLLSSRTTVLALASLVLLLTYPSLQWLFNSKHLERQIAELQQPQASVPKEYSLRLSTDGLRGEAEEIILSSRDKLFVLNFNVPEKLEKTFRYRAEILDAAGKLVSQIDGLQPAGEYDTFSLTCSRSAFKPSAYLLNLYLLDANLASTSKVFFYPFAIHFKD